MTSSAAIRQPYLPWGPAFRGPTVTPVADDELSYKKRIGAVITELRLLRGFPRQQDLADTLNVHVSTIGRWETGTTMPDAYGIRELARVLNVDYGILIDPPDRLPPDVLDVGSVVAATLRREVVKRAARRRGRRDDETPGGSR